MERTSLLLILIGTLNISGIDSIRCTVCNYTTQCEFPKKYQLPTFDVLQHPAGSLESPIPEYPALVKAPEKKLKIYCFKGVIADVNNNKYTLPTAIGIQNNVTHAEVCAKYKATVEKRQLKYVNCHLCNSDRCNNTARVNPGGYLNFAIFYLSFYYLQSNKCFTLTSRII